ncbi:hypothetical protein BT93_L4709 [Corymbia citriodora subsp. variegata]|uniref:non-specific serine/threonine protein kinase n=1 Tax=Corymbia citriodora subsp. variegata TaxID=360336 RepID=A0A8T0CW93_CORYI|nr:hypothetical protein BT93_L4709 [Corymbia citriodora subsp. variegata]
MEPRSISFVKFRSCHFLVGIVLLLCFTQVSSTTNETDKLSLLAFKAGITEDPLNVLSSWNDSMGFCQWYGVTCGRRHQRVTVLDLRSQKLSGSISPHIGNLSFLRELQLTNNSFNHEIPPQINSLSRLRILRLGHNSLVGEIPENISACSNLITLILQYNQLTGKIPTQVGSIPNLRNLSLNVNNLTGSMPSSIGNLSSLELLHLSRNNLGGSIPPVLGHLPKLQIFYVGGNKLSGPIPTGVLNLSSLTDFDVGFNQIRGSLPADICFGLPNLRLFSIFMNLFEGQVPPSISNCTKVGILLLAFNKLSGKVPSLENLHELQYFDILNNQLEHGKPEDLNFFCSLTNLTKLVELDISCNSFGGVLPNCIGKLSITLTSFGAGGNLLFGEIPKQIENLVNLEVLIMDGNKLSGVLPSNLGNLRNLSLVHLNDNYLEGTIPSSLGNLTKLTLLFLGGNNFQDQIPSELSNCQFLNVLNLSSNNLSGTISPNIMSITSLANLFDLSHNRLTGALPMEVGKLRFLTTLDISDNMLGGEIPNNLGDCVALVSLRMGGNSFHGSIPQSINALRGIEELDLSRNNFSGEIPQYLEAFPSLKFLNLSYNNFNGMLPHEGVFKNAASTSIIGNAKLCGGLPEFQLPKCISTSSKSRKVHHVLRLSAVVICGLLAIALVLAILYLYWWKKQVQETVSSSNDVLCPNVSYGTLLKATNGFSSTTLIGVGSFGSVYKGVLENNRIAIAVKVLHLVGRGALKSFIVECQILTVCSSVDYQGNDFKAIIYDFMDNGSLEQWLHPKAMPSLGNKPPIKLNFTQRINIAINVASALDYLHHECHIPIIHCDLKPSNVLLDAQMVAHVGDFGLAKFLLGSSLDTVANQMSSMGLRGTIGYAPPEMFTGLCPTDDKFRDNFTLHNFVMAALPQQALEITDHFLLLEMKSHFGPNSPQHWVSERYSIFQECLVMVYNIGASCSNEVLGRRMSIKGVASQLQKIRQKIFALGLHEQDELTRDI